MILSWAHKAALLLCICSQATHSLTIPRNIPSDNVFQSSSLEARFVSAIPGGGPASRTGWTITADSTQAGWPATNVLDGNKTTFFHTQYNPTNVALPHKLVIDTKIIQIVNGVTYLPRQDGSKNGNIGQHKVYTSTDGTNWVLVAYGTWYDDQSEKTAVFEPRQARYVRIDAITEAGGRGSWTSASEINVYTLPTLPQTVKGGGAWGATIDFPLVPVAATVQPKGGKILLWSSWSPINNGVGSGQTLTATYDPATAIVSQRLVTNTKHDMFCPGTALDVSGNVVVTGGNNAQKTSVFSLSAAAWAPAVDMKTARGYQSSVTAGDGRIFTIGGSYTGGQGGKNGEVYDPKTNTSTKLPGCSVTPMYTADKQGVFRWDNHAWLFNWKQNTILQAGPSKKMNWYNISGTGAVTSAGSRGDDADAMCGNAVMYDAVAGKVLTVGGSPNYQNSLATTNANILTLGDPKAAVTVQKLKPMAYARIFANGVVLPDGTVFIAGGQSYGLPFSDGNGSYTPEIFNPKTLAFTSAAPNTVPRVYHSFALLMADARVIVGGGGLCNTCATNHLDAQIYTPQYLLNADGSTVTTRPAISLTSAQPFKPGMTITVWTTTPVTSFSMIRYGSTTHTVNTDQRRIALTPTLVSTNKYTMVLGTADYGVVTPGYWMLFAINSAGVPSVASTIQIT